MDDGGGWESRTIDEWIFGGTIGILVASIGMITACMMIDV